ncbi:MAG: PD-(D/E)XK nuclease family protein, partial [Candidatus Izemoplasmatales bacterium]|nr:PD-(D/E)XK nuclease family protein [Candidatus Izemoplasmatales bacterium]
LLICANQDKLQILNYLSDNSIFLNLDFYDSHFPYLSFNKNYLFYLSKNFGIKPYLGERFRKYFDYIDISKEYISDKIKHLQEIKKTLLKNNILIEKKRVYSQVYQVNDLFVPDKFNQNVEKIYTNKVSENKVALYKAIDHLEQVKFVYEKVIDLLENGIDINKINILNSTVENDVSLGKLFHDSSIPYNINKRFSLSEYPVMINLIKHLRETGYEKALNYLTGLEKNDVINKIIRVFNTYEKVLFIEDIEVLIYELKRLSLIDSGYAEAINITSFNNLVYREDEYYILMNYYDDAFPKKYVDNDYLIDSEVKEIDYPTSIELNNYNKQMITDVLNQIDHLILVYPNQVIDETRPARFNLRREINYFVYKHEYKFKTYLQNLVYLDYTKKRYDFNNYNIYTADLDRLNNVYHHEYQEYIPFFTGINDKTLTYLIDKFNTLTAYKLESYSLCPFQYYLKYLLKLDSFEDNIFTYIGNVIHKALELKMKNGIYDKEELFMSYNFPKKENYKRDI